MCVEIIQNRNLAFQIVERLACHGLLAPSGRIRRHATKSQARMVGARRKCPLLVQNHTLSSRRQHHRRTVDGSANREGSLQCGAACSAGSPALIRSHACWRHRKVKGANGISHSGKTVKVFRHGWQIPRRTHTRWCLSSLASRSRRPWPMIV
jgi:hypothetical protein